MNDSWVLSFNFFFGSNIHNIYQCDCETINFKLKFHTLNISFFFYIFMLMCAFEKWFFIRAFEEKLSWKQAAVELKNHVDWRHCFKKKLLKKRKFYSITPLQTGAFKFFKPLVLAYHKGKMKHLSTSSNSTLFITTAHHVIWVKILQHFSYQDLPNVLNFHGKNQHEICVSTKKKFLENGEKGEICLYIYMRTGFIFV